MIVYSHQYRKNLSLGSSGIFNTNPYEDLSNIELSPTLVGMIRAYMLCLKNTFSLIKCFFSSSRFDIANKEVLYLSYGDQACKGGSVIVEDRYLGGLGTYLAESVGASGLLQVEVPGFKGGCLVIRVLSLNEFFLAVIIGLLDSILVVPHIFRKLKGDDRKKALQHIAHAYFVRTFVWFSAFSKVGRLCPRLRTVIFPMEGATWEFVLSHAITSRCNFLGCLHGFIRPGQLALFRLIDYIVDSGRSFRLLTQDRWSHQKILEYVEETNVIKVPSFRFHNDDSNSVMIKATERNIRERLLVIGGLDKIDTISMVRDVVAIHNQKARSDMLDIKVRFHPTDTVSAKSLKGKDATGVSFDSGGSIRTALADCDFALISHSSSASVDALLMDKPFVLYKTPCSQYLNPIPMTKVTHVFGVEELNKYFQDPHAYKSTEVSPFFSVIETSIDRKRLLLYIGFIS